MLLIDENQLAAALSFTTLIPRLRDAFRAGDAVPQRQHLTVPVPGGRDATLLVMPAWQAGRYLGVKLVTVFPDNGSRSLPSVMGQYLLLDGQTGQPLAQMDARRLTVRRTAAASALAASYLAPPEASRLLMVGAGALAPHLIRAHATVRPIRHVALWNRTPARADALAALLQNESFTVTRTDDLEAAARQADVISCATLSQTPLIRGAWLRPGTHLDLVGGYTPQMREADDDALRHAYIFVDTRAGALAEAGDLVQPMAAGHLQAQDVQADLFDLTQGRHPGRQAPEDRTLFKSVGTALEDLAAAILVYEATATHNA